MGDGSEGGGRGRWVRQVQEMFFLYLLILLHASLLWQVALQPSAEQTNLSTPRRMSPPQVWQLLSSFGEVGGCISGVVWECRGQDHPPAGL